MHSIRVLTATVAALAFASAAQAGQPVRIQPTVTQLLQPDAAKGEAAAKPAPRTRVPGPVITTHVRRTADGRLETWCSEDHGPFRAGQAHRHPEQQQ